ncbi:HAD-IIA family hydrolase [Desulfosporosinus sp. BG]|uniref:HAD-IIA family hydrolase n=1 Tax=Desulfosporosinus sp. BG TaxID=1633135 RepID=UPI00083ADFBF|nr:HAD-IIA family hydrolase [Desulfosporosinus sp. BG]ODA39141.1 HAD-superfamily hydrolase, subfamily IIA [Desulfosporosinus sp. BG]
MSGNGINIENIDVVVFDLDGTVYYGSKKIPGANETIGYFREMGKHVYFVTNNSTKTRRQIFEKILSMGIDCQHEEVLTSGYMAALYAKRQEMKDIYIFGSENLKHEFEDQGLAVEQSESAENLLIGYDPNMTYKGLTSALQVALHAKCIMACNRERTFPGDGERCMPGCGAMTASIEWCANRECDVIIGKPNTFMLDLLVEMNGYVYNRILVIGDTYESDIEMAKRAGCPSILISRQKYDGTLYVDTIGDISKLLAHKNASC